MPKAGRVSSSRDVRRILALVRLGLFGCVPLVIVAVLFGGRLLDVIVIAPFLALMALVMMAAGRLQHESAEDEYAALHDPVTELPNRILFHDRVAQAIALADRRGTTVAVLLLDLDRFKEVNDTLGHHHGDLLLHRVGRQLRGALRESDTAARLGGDEFGILLAEVSGPDGARAAAAKVRDAIAERIVLEGIGLEVEASVGIALYPHHAGEAESLMQHADVAMYAAKSAHTGVEVYSTEHYQYSVDRLELIADLRGAIRDGQLVLHFQPKANLSTGRVVGVEALVRWEHPRRGVLYPDEFLPSAEGTGLMKPLTQHVLECALAQCRAWHDLGMDLTVAVNLSTRNLLDLDLPDRIACLLEASGVSPAKLELEITESMIMTDPPRAKAVIARLRGLGVGLAIDDFGTGYSSLQWLTELPVTSLKVDKSFVLGMEESVRNSVIVRSTVQLGQNLGLNVVAEGVESQDAWDKLSALGCDEAQGYYLSRPCSPEALTRWMLESAHGRR